MERHEGTCKGGPWDGRQLAHETKTKVLLRPVPSFGENTKVVEIGEYRLNDYGHWHWHETKEGRAMRDLFGPPRGD